MITIGTGVHVCVIQCVFKFKKHNYLLNSTHICIMVCASIGRLALLTFPAQHCSSAGRPLALGYISAQSCIAIPPNLKAESNHYHASRK